MYPALCKSYKGVFPFSIGTTSFIYPDDYVPNVKMLGPYLENIELLLFESQHTDALPSKQVIGELAILAKDYNLNYNVHLPTDISISSRDPQQQNRAADTILSVAERVAPLMPTTLTLHVPYEENSFEPEFIESWQERVIKNLETILASGIPGRHFSVENLDYPFELLAPIISELDLAVCLDCGHLILHGDDLHTFFNTYTAQTTIIHLYGVEQNHFHGPLDRLPEKFIVPTMSLLAKYSGTVSLEVFSYSHLDASLKFMETCWNHHQKGV
ncbi:MAG: sugar phosphate isomerase/epimerase [Deltaproteobacteria bacterium]|jgi:sugar phosphate isomerase/epimerase|nr:sugar phosphate isomerase/epimerase [Deltaproteobacteria bacterium]MBW2488796.1 sugar phosphate isomerase/epimerase [Deltaproteobacteria bacterium]